jgi:hypothetical protein
MASSSFWIADGIGCSGELADAAAAGADSGGVDDPLLRFCPKQGYCQNIAARTVKMSALLPHEVTFGTGKLAFIWFAFYRAAIIPRFDRMTHTPNNSNTGETLEIARKCFVQPCLFQTCRRLV